MPGPAPSPNARRRNDRDAWRTLPAVCRTPAPEWPLRGRKPAGLIDLWRHLWTLPVAAIWHEQNAVRLVARYALLTLAAEDVTREDVVRVAAECRQIEDRLLISPSFRLRARVLIAPAPAAGSQAGNGEVADIDERRRRRLAAAI